MRYLPLLGWILLLGAVPLLAAGEEEAAPTPPPAPTLVLFPGGTAAESITAPAAYSGSAGVYYVGAFGIRNVSVGPKGRRHLTNDAAVTGGLGLGKPGHGLLVSLTVADLSNPTDGYLSAKWQLCPETLRAPAIAVGVENFLDNVDRRQALRSPFAVVSRTFWDRDKLLAGEPAFARTTVSLGYGGGRFGHEPFVAVASSLSDRSQAVVEHDQFGFNLGYSIAPWPSRPGVVIGFYGMRLDDPTFRTAGASVTYAWWQR